MFLISRYVCAMRNGGYHTSSPSFGSLKVGALFDNANQSPIRKQARAIFPGWNELEEEDKFTLVELRRGVLKLVVVVGSARIVRKFVDDILGAPPETNTIFYDFM